LSLAFYLEPRSNIGYSPLSNIIHLAEVVYMDTGQL
jgi:hypothetical protein